MRQRNDTGMRWGRIGVYAVLLILALCAMAALRHCPGQGKCAAPVKGTDTIHAAVVYGPNSFRVLESADGNDSITGINYQLLKALEDSLQGVKVVLHPVIDRDEALAKVASGTYDILASLPADNHLKKTFLTTDDVYLDRMVLLQKKNSSGLLPARSALDLENDTVHVERGSAATRRLENLQREIGGKIHVVEEDGLSEEYLAMKVATGVWKYAVVNERTAEDMKGQYPDLDYSTPVSFTQFQVWVLPIGRDTLLSKINRFLGSR